MADFNPIFEIDAAKILAKLHLAGQSQVPNSKVINTGIKDNDPNAKPDNPGKVTFELSKSGEYQLAILKKIQYRVALNPQKDKDLTKLDEELKKLKQPSIFDDKAQAEAAKEEGKEDKNADKGKEENKDADKKKEEANEKTSLTDKNAQKKTEVNDSLKVPSFLDYITEADEKPDDKDKKKIEEVQKKILEKLDAIATFEASGKEDAEAEKSKMQVKNMFAEGKYSDLIGKHEDGKFAEDVALFKKCLAEENKHRQEYKASLLDSLNGGAMEDMKEYFINFAGKDNQAKIDQNKIVQVVFDLDGKTFDDPNSFKGIKDGKIETKDVLQKMQKEEEQMQADVKKRNEPCTRTIGCAVGYKIDIE